MAETVKQEIDFGGSAFPIEGGSESGLWPDPGMSLRDWFAGQAVNGLLAADPNNEFTPRGAADCAYKIADAMIAARKGGAA